jgi:hypothetical protein
VDFPILALLEQACCAFLVDALHPQGLRCPGCRESRCADYELADLLAKNPQQTRKGEQP